MQDTLNTSGAAKLIGKSTHWLYINAERLEIPRYRIGGRWVYSETELCDWFEQQKVRIDSKFSPSSNKKSKTRMHVEF
jgi:hypothetical protein